MPGKGNDQNNNKNQNQPQRNYNIPEFEGRWNPLTEGIGIAELSEEKKQELDDWYDNEKIDLENEYAEEKDKIFIRIGDVSAVQLQLDNKRLKAKWIQKLQTSGIAKFKDVISEFIIESGQKEVDNLKKEIDNLKKEVDNQKKEIDNKKQERQIEFDEIKRKRDELINSANSELDKTYNNFVIEQTEIYNKKIDLIDNRKEEINKNISDALIISRERIFLKRKLDELNEAIKNVEYTRNYDDYNSYLKNNLDNVNTITQVIAKNSQKNQANKENYNNKSKEISAEIEALDAKLKPSITNKLKNFWDSGRKVRHENEKKTLEAQYKKAQSDFDSANIRFNKENEAYEMFLEENKDYLGKKADKFVKDKKRYSDLMNEKARIVETQKNIEKRTDELLEVVKNDEFIKGYFDEYKKLIIPDETISQKDIVNMYNLRIKWYDSAKKIAIDNMTAECKRKENEIKAQKEKIKNEKIAIYEKEYKEIRNKYSKDISKLDKTAKTKVDAEAELRAQLEAKVNDIYNKAVTITDKKGEEIIYSYAEAEKDFKDIEDQYNDLVEQKKSAYKDKVELYKKFAGFRKAVDDLKNSPKKFGYNSGHFNDMIEALEECGKVIDHMYDEDADKITDDYRKRKCAEAIVACQDYIAKRERDFKITERSILGHYRLDCAYMLSSMLNGAYPGMELEIQNVRYAKAHPKKEQVAENEPQIKR